MNDLRRRVTLISFAALLAAGGCDAVDPSRPSGELRRDMAAGREAASAWIAGARAAEPDVEAVIATGYLERQRLGLGSPFRLAELALRDPRLDEDGRERLAWAILSRTWDGAGYQVDGAALDRLATRREDLLRGIGGYHLRLIENAVRESSDPRAGELAVRLAYALAGVDAALSSQAVRTVANAAALIRDREVARQDVRRLFRAAEVDGLEVLQLLTVWRAERKFEVELPPAMPLPQRVELEAMDMAPRLAQSIRSLTRRLESGDNTTLQPSIAVQSPLLTPAAALRLREAADSMNMPPQTPIVIATRMHRAELMGRRALTRSERQAREVFEARAVDEERFVAEYALLQRVPPFDATTSVIAIWAATAMRAYGQESVWFPGMGGPSSRELEERFGLGSLRFAETVPAEWRPYYRRQLESAFVDLYRVLPALDLKGLHVLFGEVSPAGSSLALHDPRARRIVLPPSTSAGTIAHEVAHDLDWQVARRRFRVRGDYASDHAMRGGKDRLSMWVQDLAVASLGTFTADEPDAMLPHMRRPAEVFARNVDWFVAMSLAAEGRINGFLSSVQDDVLTGYGTVRPPDISGAAGNALLSILDDVAPVYPVTRDWFQRHYGSERALTAYDLVRRVTEVTAAERAGEAAPYAALAPVESALQAVETAKARGFAAIDDWICRAPGASYNPQLERSRRKLVVEAAAASARGIAMQRARELAGAEGEQWLARRFFGAPWPRPADMDPAVVDMLEALADAARSVERVDVRIPSLRFDLSGPPRHCADASLRLPYVTQTLTGLTGGARR
jgi:hypothetical protein